MTNVKQPRLCINCKHYNPSNKLCFSPKNGVSLEDGSIKPRLPSIERTDTTYADCKSDGLNFEPLGLHK